jgi:hypothetical protein
VCATTQLNSTRKKKKKKKKIKNFGLGVFFFLKKFGGVINAIYVNNKMCSDCWGLVLVLL